MITRRTLLKTAAAAAATSVISAPAIAQGTKKITFLTWNIVDQKALIKGWISASSRPVPASRSSGSTRRDRSCRPSTRRSSPPARRPT